MKSTPKPRSRASILSLKRQKRCAGAREGALNPASITAEEPSARATQRARRRQPCSARASLSHSICAKCSMPAKTPSCVTIGSGNGSRAAKSGRGRSGTRGPSRLPSACSRRSRTVSAGTLAWERRPRRLFGVEAPLGARARQIVELADELQAQPPQEMGDLGRETQSLDRQGRKRGSDLSTGNDNGRRGREPGKRMRAPQGLGKSKS